MSVNFYARRIPSKQEKEELNKLMDENKFESALKKAKEMYERDGSCYDEHYGSFIHLGHRATKWKFLWNANFWKIPDGEMIDGKYHYKYKVGKYYDLTKESIREFLSREDIMIVSEYYRDDMEPVDSTDPEDTEVWTVDEFMDMALNWYPDGYDSRTYAEETNRHYYENERKQFFEELGYEVGNNYDFYSDGLRFSIHDYFS